MHGMTAGDAAQERAALTESIAVSIAAGGAAVPPPDDPPAAS